MTIKAWIDLLASIAMLAAGGTILAVYGPRLFVSKAIPSIVPKEAISVQGLSLKGNPLARVAIVEYSDFECPFCGKFVKEVLPQIEEKYIATGRVAFAFKHFPIEGKHPMAVRAAQLSECAGRQGQFWAAHDGIFALKSPLTAEALDTTATKMPLNQTTLADCQAAGSLEVVKAHAQEARKLGIRSTPSFLIGLLSNNQVKVTASIVGAQGFSSFQKTLDALMR